MRYLAANQHPDHDTLAAFRRRHLTALGRLFGQVLQLCQRAGLVKLEHVAVDGTKIQANASRFRARRYQQMSQEEQRLEAEIRGWLQEAERVDEAEDQRYGKGRRGDQLPPELATREQRLKKIRELKADLEREAREKAERARVEAERRIAQRQEEEQRRGRRFGGRTRKVPDVEQAHPAPTAQRNWTDPQSRIMKDKATNSFQQAYHAPAAVDAPHQVIVAAAVTQQEYDREQLVPLLQQVERRLGRKPRQVSADSGYYSPQALGEAYVGDVDLYLPPEGERWVRKRGSASRWARQGAVLNRLREKMRTEAARLVYRKRAGIVEPVFGCIKEVRGFRRFLLRGLAGVTQEWMLLCTVHNLHKLFAAGFWPSRLPA